jgi:hypothetical protein
MFLTISCVRVISALSFCFLYCSFLMISVTKEFYLSSEIEIGFTIDSKRASVWEATLTKCVSILCSEKKSANTSSPVYEFIRARYCFSLRLASFYVKCVPVIYYSGSLCKFSRISLSDCSSRMNLVGARLYLSTFLVFSSGSSPSGRSGKSIKSYLTSWYFFGYPSKM